MASTPPPSEIHPLAAYLRDSGGDSQELSISQQEAALKTWAAQNGHVIVQWFKDEARPGSSTVGRDGFQAMMAHFRRGCTEEGVVIWKFSRFARDIDDSQFYKADLRRRGYKVISINDNIPDGPEGRFFEAAIDWMNERFLEDLSRDVKRGLENLVKAYGAIPGTPPRGFIRQPVELPPRRDGKAHIAHRWIPDPEWIPQIQQAFAMRAAGKPLAQIAAETKLYKSLNCYTTFYTNKLYIGVLEYGDFVIEEYCEPIIDKVTWDAVQDVIKLYAARRHTQSNGPINPRRSVSRYLLSGLAHCAKCGSPLYGASIIRAERVHYDRYACTQAGRRRDCVQKPIARNILETAVLDDLKNFVLQPNNLRWAQKRIHQEQDVHLAELDQQRSEINTRLGSLRRRIANITDAVAETGITRALADKLRQLEANEAELIAETRELDRRSETRMPEYSDGEIEKMSQDLIACLSGNDHDMIQRVLRSLVAKIIVDRDETRVIGMTTYFYPPYETLGPSPPDDDIICRSSSRPRLGAHYVNEVKS